MQQQKYSEFLNLYKPIHDDFTRYCNSRAYGVLETEDFYTGYPAPTA